MSSHEDIVDQGLGALRLGVVYGVIMLLFFLTIAQLPMPLISTMKPLFLLMGLYYWTIYKPSLLPFWFIFALGLGLDFLANTPLGLQCFVYMVIMIVLRGQRRFFLGQSFIMIWSGFALAALMCAMMVWGLYGLGKMDFPPILPVAGQVFVSVMLYPAVSLVLIGTHRLLLSSRPAFT